MKLVSQQGDRRFWFLRLEPPYDTPIPHFASAFVTVLLACDPTITPNKQAEISAELVQRDCRYVLAWGHNATSWDDSVDMAFISTDADFNPPSDRHVMTTWHDNDTIADVIWFAIHNTNFNSHDFRDYLALMIGTNPDIESDVLQAIHDQLTPT